MKRRLVIGIIVLLVIIFGVYFLISNNKKYEDASNLPEYYKNLAEDCESKESYNCCMSSVNNMADGNYLLAPGDTLVESECPDGFQGNMLKCPDSYRWCEPIK